MRKTLISLGLGAALSVAGAAQAAVMFDRDGTGGGANVIETDVFDWAPGNVLFQNIVTSPIGTTSFDLVGHGNLSAFLFNGSSVGGAVGGSEFTYTFSIPMLATNTFAGASFWNLNAVAPGTFEIFYDAATDINTNSGAGFADGHMVLQGGFIPAIAVPGEAGNVSVTVDPPPKNPLDGFGANGKPGITSDIIGGGVSFEIDATYADSQFFLTDVVTADLTFGFDLNLSSQVKAPFDQTNPAAIVGGVAGETSTFNAGTTFGATAGSVGPYNATPNYGGDGVNDASCAAFPCDLHAQSDASSTFNTVPAPGALALLGAGLFGIGAASLRRSRSGRVAG